MREKVNFHKFLKKMTPRYLKKQFLSRYEEKEAPVEFVFNIEE